MSHNIKYLVLGQSGTLGNQILNVFGEKVIGFEREYVDINDFETLKTYILKLKPIPEAIINCIAYNDVDGAEKNPELAFKLNSEFPKNLALIANLTGSILVHYSTNYVFDGQKGEYDEKDIPNPVSVYGKSKLQGEKNVISIAKKFYLIRTSVIFGPKGSSSQGKKSFVELMLELAQKQSEIKTVNDEINSLTFSVDLARASKVLLEESKQFGIYHMVNSGEASWYDFAREIFSELGNQNIKLIPVKRNEFPVLAKRPKKAVLLNTKLRPFRPWQEALAEYLNKGV